MNSILIIDDCEMDRDLYDIIIEQFDPNIQISHAKDGQEGLNKLASMATKPSVILLDINMPVLDGFGFLQRYDAVGNSRVYVMIASEEQHGDIRRANEHPHVTGHLLKPLSLVALKQLRSGY